jgi:hypothetical protein
MSYRLCLHWLFCVTLKQKGKSNVNSIYFKKIKTLKKIKKSQTTKKKKPKLFLKLFEISPNRDSNMAKKTKISQLPNMRRVDNNHADVINKNIM